MNRPAYVTPAALGDLISRALQEDLGEGDHSSLASVLPDTQQTARLLVKDHGRLAGMEVAIEIFGHYDPTLHV